MLLQPTPLFCEFIVVINELLLIKTTSIISFERFGEDDCISSYFEKVGSESVSIRREKSICKGGRLI